MVLLAESSKNNAAKTLILHAWARWLVQNDASNEPVSVAAPAATAAPPTAKSSRWKNNPLSTEHSLIIF